MSLCLFVECARRFLLVIGRVCVSRANHYLRDRNFDFCGTVPEQAIARRRIQDGLTVRGPD